MRKAVLTFAAALSLLAGQGASVATAAGVDGEEIRAFHLGFSGAPQGDREAGPYAVTFTNADPMGPHDIFFVRLSAANERATNAQIIAAADAVGASFSRGENPFCPTCFFNYFAGGAFALPSGPSATIGPDFRPGIPQLLPGRYAYVCAVGEADGTPHYKLGMLGTFWAK